MTAIEFEGPLQNQTQIDRAYLRVKKTSGTAGLLAIACAAHVVGVHPGQVHDVVLGLTPYMQKESGETRVRPQTAKPTESFGESYSKTKQAANAIGMTVYGMYYFGEDGMALAVNEAAIGLMERSFDGGAARLAAAGITAAAVTGWNDVALHWNEKMLRRAMDHVEPSKLVESNRPIVQQLGLIKSNIREIFVNEDAQLNESMDKKTSKVRAKIGRIKEWMGDHASVLNTSIVGAPVGFNDELMRKKLDVRMLKRRKIEGIIAKHSAVFGATWGALAATRGLDQVNMVLETVLKPENLAVGLTYIYGNKITKELFANAPESSVQMEVVRGPIDFEDVISENLIVNPDGTLDPIHGSSEKNMPR